MLDVCPRRSNQCRRTTLIGGEAAIQASRATLQNARGHRRTPGSSRSEYQNTVESAYGLVPRPPQTPAARFKRLYRK